MNVKATRAFSIVSLCLVGFVGCSKKTPLHPEGVYESEATRSVAAFVTANHLEASRENFLKVSEVFLKTPKAQRRTFLKKIITTVIKNAKLAPMIQTILRHSFGLEMKEASALERLTKLEEGALSAVVEELFKKFQLDAHPEVLDTFPTVPIEDIPAIQQALFVAGKPTGSDEFPKPFQLDYPAEKWNDILLKDKGCQRLERVRRPVFPEFNIFDGMEPVKELTTECFQENSVALAKLLNKLSNTINGEAIQPVRLRWDGHPEKETWISSYGDFYRTVHELGFTIELYNTRVLVNFAGWSFFDGKEYRAIRGATHFRVPIGPNQTVRVPAEHGEVDILIRRGKVRYAGMQWFFGIPDPKYRGVATFWRPHLYLQAGWARYLHEFTRVFSPGAPDELTPWLNATAYVMRGFQAVYDRFQPPLNSYGLFICSDSMTFALAKHWEMAGGPRPAFRVTNAFPTLYAQEVILPAHPELGTGPKQVDLRALFAEYAEVGLTTLGFYAPPDTEVSKDPAAMKHRLHVTFEPKDDSRLFSFREFRDGDLQKIRQ